MQKKFCDVSAIAQGQTTARKNNQDNARNAFTGWHQIEFPPALTRRRER
jgi:hypothetical protein